MTPATRILINTLIQYFRTLINIILGFYSTRLVLAALGESDYGVYMLIAGVVGMLSFFTNALSITTQRFLSFHQTNVQHKAIVFSNSLAIHISASLILLIVLEISGTFLFDGILRIPENRIEAAKLIFHIALIMIALSIVTSPFRAALVSQENLLFISIIDILDGCWKVAIALCITYSDSDRLIQYALLTLGIYVFTFLSFSIFDFIKYPECKFPKISHLNKTLLKHLTSFAGWSLYSSGCIIGRNQGISLILNFFYGTILNAAYAISFQVSGAVNYIGAAIQTAFSPRITMTEGYGNRQLMLYYSNILSKVSLLLMAMLGIPVFADISDILYLWLNDVPEYTSTLCRVIIAASILDQISYGLITANRAIGNLKKYSLVVDTIKIITCPILFILLYIHVPLLYAIWVYTVFELFSAFARILILKQTAELKVRWWLIEVVWKSSIPIFFLIIIWFYFQYQDFSISRFIIEMAVSSLLFIALCYTFSINPKEKTYINHIVSQALCRIKGS